MNAARLTIVGLFLLVLAMPFFAQRLRGNAGSAGDGARGPSATDLSRVGREGTLIVVTPHVEQIRIEFATAFSRWHQRVHGSPVRIDYRVPGGTTEILKLLESQFDRAIRDGQIKPDGSAAPGAVSFDVMFGGGTFDHGRLRRGVTTTVRDAQGKDQRVTIAMSTPPTPPFDEAFLNTVFGANVIGTGQLWQDNRRDASGAITNPNDWQHWFGTALSGFGIIFNRDLLASRGIKEPASFRDLADFRYVKSLALADPRQSGSVATLYDSILNKEGFDAGFRLLREIGANARYFAAASTQPPQDVGQGDALAGVAIDFYGRGQAQALLRAGQRPEDARLGYVDPAGAVYIDADPVSIIRGGPNPALARRFVEFCLTPEAQALWQFAPLAELAPGAVTTDASNPPNPADPSRRLGPERYRLRRMPATREMYAKYLGAFADRTDPFAIASTAKVRGWRDGLIVMMGAFAIDTAPECRAAWSALNSARADANFPRATLDEMERLFYAMPEHTMLDGSKLPFNEANYKKISDDIKRWRDPERSALTRIAYTEFFRDMYRRVVDLASQRR
jgi:iron(III) transport system substrate-binding protein